MSKEEKQKQAAQTGEKTIAKAAEPAPEQSPNSPGKQLSEGRKRLGLSQQQVADRLHLRITSVQAVENDAREEGVSVTFTKGYVRLYAKLVHLDAQPLLDSYDSLHANEQEPAKLQSFSRRVSREAHDQRWNMVSIVVVLLVLGSIVFWWVDREGYFKDSGRKVTQAWETLVGDEEQMSQTSDKEQVDDQRANNVADDFVRQDAGPQIPEEEVALLDDDNTIIQSIDDNVEDALEDTTASNSFEDFSDAADETLESANETVQEAFEPRNSADIIEGVYSDAGYLINADGTVNVVFTFKDDCWVSIKDGNGETMAYGVKVKGRVMEVSGVPPVNVILGAPRSVDIEFGGQRVNMDVYPGGETAKFTLPVVSD